jgi:tetraacyldisaccharide 4'-kinase
MWRRLNAPRTRLDAHVISYGNITAGGTGKTPAVIERVQRELAAGKRVAVLTRGYGSESNTEPVVVKPEGDIHDLVCTIGDEPALIAMKAPGVVIAKGADRIAAAQKAIEKFGCDALILDDGYQYVKLERDENVLVIDATNPFGNERLLPRGILREDIEAVSRATSIVLTRCDQVENLDALDEKLNALNPNVPTRHTAHAPVQFRRLADGETIQLDDMRGESVIAACGIGNPDAFATTLSALDVAVDTLHAFADHQAIAPQALNSTLPIIVTDKDAVRIQNPPENILALEIALCDWPQP